MQAASESRKNSILNLVPNAIKVYGVNNSFIDYLVKKYCNGGFELVEILWRAGAFEERMMAVKLLNKHNKKDPTRAMKFIETCSIDIDNWAI